MYDIITIGSGTVDVFVDTAKKELRKHEHHEDVCYNVGSKQLIKQMWTDTGGSGTNTAVAFARAGLKTAWLGVVGTDIHAKSIVESIKKEGVTFLGKQKKGHSGYSVVLVGLHHDRTILAYKGVNDCLELPKKDITKETRWLYVGSLLGDSLETAKKMVKSARQNNIPFAYNPSTYQATGGIKSLKSLLTDCSLLILNLEEANLLLGAKHQQPKELIPPLLTFAKRVVITDGPRGAIGSNHQFIYTLCAKPCLIKETTGAGDAFAAGTIIGLIHHLPFEDCMRLGYAEATSVIGHIGAKTGLLVKKALIRKMNSQKIKVAVTPLKMDA